MNLSKLINLIQQSVEVLNSLSDYAPVSERVLRRIESYQRYALANHPLGKSQRGMKKWIKRYDHSTIFAEPLLLSAVEQQLQAWEREK